MSDGPPTPARDGLRVAIRLMPRAKTDRLFAVSAVAESGHVLRASVTAPADRGRANEALLRLLAQAWHLPCGDFSIVVSAASCNKAGHIAGDPQRLIDKIAPEIASLPGC